MKRTERHHHTGAYAFINVQDAILLVHKQRGPYRGCWDLPGGGIEPGETHLDALRREVYEETELRPKIGMLMTSVTVRCCHLLERAQPEELEHEARIYEATLDEPSPPRVRATDEDVSSAKWVRLDELRGLKLTPIAQEALSTFHQERAEGVKAGAKTVGTREHFSTSVAPKLLRHGAIVLHLIDETTLDKLEARFRGHPDGQTFVDAVRAHYLPRFDDRGRRTKWGFCATFDGEVAGCSLLGIGSWENLRGYTGAFTLPEMRGRGVAPGSKPHLFYLGFELLGLHRIETGCAASNIASKRSIEKTPGFRFEGTLRGYARSEDGTFEDEHRYAIVRDDWEGLYDPTDVTEG